GGTSAQCSAGITDASGHNRRFAERANSFGSALLDSPPRLASEQSLYSLTLLRGAQTIPQLPPVHPADRGRDVEGRNQQFKEGRVSHVEAVAVPDVRRYHIRLN